MIPAPIHTVFITERFESLAKKLRDRAKVMRQAGHARVIVGYRMPYALRVHELVEMKLKGQPRRGRRRLFHGRREAIGTVERASLGGRYWDPEGAQAKFLEKPARRLNNDGTFREILLDSLRRGMTLVGALLNCGRRLLEESLKIVPRDTGDLARSGFVRVEK